MHDKIKTLEEIGSTLQQERTRGKKIVHCHGVFDLLHPGHIRHFQEAKNQGDLLVVSITPDKFVNKGPGRPAFTESLRVEQIASLACVDFVVLNDSPDAISIIQKIKADLYAKGIEYKNHNEDITGKIEKEALAIAEVGGKIYYTDDIVFSSSTLLNTHFDADTQRLKPFLDELKTSFSKEEVLKNIDALKELNVLVIGDAIIDEYQYVNPLGQSGKGVHMTAECLEKEVFLGGSLIIANHLAEFAGNVTLLTSTGEKCPHKEFISSQLSNNISSHFFSVKNRRTLTKKRYVLKDGRNITKLFETYSSNEPLLTVEQTNEIVSFIKEKGHQYDLILVSDFGNGFTNDLIVKALSESKSFLAINTQTNSGNRGYNVITHYDRADFISLNEPELRLAMQNRYSSLEGIVQDLSFLLHCGEISITRGVMGVYYYSSHSPSFTLPALTTHAIDRVGAGDCYLALSALSACKKYPPLFSAFLGSIAAALGVQIVGNKEAIKKVDLCKYVTRLYK